MDFDELLRNVISTEEDLSQQASSSPPPAIFLGNLNMDEALPKTVDDDWNEIIRADNGEFHQPLTVAKMTLEDFLARAGPIEAYDQYGGIDNQPSIGSDPVLHFEVAAVHEHNKQPLMATDSIFARSESFFGCESGNQTAITLDSQVIEGNRVVCGNLLEKTTERKQKRMIKNRESAARSRARKQAYTNHLEREVLHLKQEQNLLEREKEVDVLLSSYPPPVARYQLRRIRSATF